MPPLSARNRIHPGEGKHRRQTKGITPLRRGTISILANTPSGEGVLLCADPQIPRCGGVWFTDSGLWEPRPGECPRIAENAPRIDFAGRSVFYLLFSRMA